MLSSILTLLALAACAGESLIQTLVFGNDSASSGSEYFCDCNFSPHRDLVSVTIFKVINQNEDQAVPCSRVFATPSPSSSGYARIEIPDSLAVKDVSYSFQFEFSDGDNAFSESWEFDPAKKGFCLASSVKKNLLDDQKVQVGLALGGIAVLLGGSSYLYSRYKKSRSLYIQ